MMKMMTMTITTTTTTTIMMMMIIMILIMMTILSEVCTLKHSIITLLNTENNMNLEAFRRHFTF